jgi:hypothetical protein
MIIRPFIYVDGIPTMRDSDLLILFDKMVRDGTDNLVFYDGQIKSGLNFIEFIKLAGNMLFVVYEDENPIGCGWLNNFKHRTAEAHFCVFSEAWDRSVEVGKLMIEKSMYVTNVDMLIGNVPKFNEIAIDFVKKCGGVILGELPYGSVDRLGKFHPMVIVYYTR